MTAPVKLEDGYYWARHDEGSTFIVCLEEGLWFTIGIAHPINEEFREQQIIGPVRRLEN